jgi:glycosyltransferase involved in cell wall biosynthesis
MEYSISYAILVHNEVDSLDKLLSFLIEHTDENDEIVILDDYSDNTQTKEILDGYTTIYDIKYEQRHLLGDFAGQKNYLKNMCTGDYIFNIDADEVPHKDMMVDLKPILRFNPTIDMFWVPRVNTVEGITQEHILAWHWSVDEFGRVNFPDWQGRIWRNRPNIKWEKPVHEQLTGYKEYSHLPAQGEFALYHPKDIKKQEEQNKFYDGIIK